MVAHVRDIKYNVILSALPAEDMSILEPNLKLVEWTFGEVLATPNEVVGYAYFPVLGIASVVSMEAGKARFEVGMYGREGFGPTSIILGHERTQNQHIVQVAGAAFKIGRLQLVAAMSKSRGFMT